MNSRRIFLKTILASGAAVLASELLAISAPEPRFKILAGSATLIDSLRHFRETPLANAAQRFQIERVVYRWNSCDASGNPEIIAPMDSAGDHWVWSKAWREARYETATGIDDRGSTFILIDRLQYPVPHYDFIPV